MWTRVLACVCKQSPTLSRGPVPELTAEQFTFQVNFGFLFLGFKKHSYYWEMVILARKVVLSVLGSAYLFDRRLQATLGTLVLFVATCLHANRMPYLMHEFNEFELFALFTVSVTFFLGQLTLSLGDVSYADTASIVAIVVNMLFLLVTIFYLVRMCIKDREYYAEKGGRKLAAVTGGNHHHPVTCESV